MRKSNAYTISVKENEPEALVKFLNDFETAGGKKVSIANRAQVNSVLSFKLLKLLSSHNLPNFFKGVGSGSELRVKVLEDIPLIFEIDNAQDAQIVINYLVVDESGIEQPATDADVVDKVLAQVQLVELRRQCLKANVILKDYFQRRGLEMQKCRLEFAKQDSKLYLATLFTMDSCDFVDVELNEKLSYAAIIKKTDKAEELFQAFIEKLNR